MPKFMDSVRSRIRDIHECLLGGLRGSWACRSSSSSVIMGEGRASLPTS